MLACTWPLHTFSPVEHLLTSYVCAGTRYISAIKTLRVLDNSGVLLERVCGPVRAYLRSRGDTVRCVVTSLVDDITSELYEELCNVAWAAAQADVEDAAAMARWVPDPVDADPSRSSASRRHADVTSLLIDIFGSQEMFVNEYRSLLAERLLAMSDFDTDRDLRNVELLKFRFGDESMQQCVVMLKDLADSKRINAIFREQQSIAEGAAPLPLNVFVLSRLFWPTFREELFELPPVGRSAEQRFRLRMSDGAGRDGVRAHTLVPQAWVHTAVAVVLRQRVCHCAPSARRSNACRCCLPRSSCRPS